MEVFAAGFWGFVGGVSLLIGALLGLYAGASQRVISVVMAIGAGVLISSVAFSTSWTRLTRREGSTRLLWGCFWEPWSSSPRTVWSIRPGGDTASARKD